MFSPIILIEGVLVLGGVCGWGLWEYIKVSRLIEARRIADENEANAKSSDEASETATSL